MSYDSRSSQLNAYRETRVKTAGQGQMIVMLYDEAVKQIDEAIALLDKETRKLDTVHNAIVKAQDCITELTVGLDLDNGGELAGSLFDLYRFFHRELTEANLQKDTGRLRSVRRLLSELRGAWAQIAGTAGGSQSGSGRAGQGGSAGASGGEAGASGGRVNYAG